jgi:hypothetical protein
MALPTLVKNWLVTTNQTIAGDANLDAGGPSGSCFSTRDRRNLMIALKNQLITGGNSNVGPSAGGAVNTWTVRYSCGGNNGGALAAGTPGDGIDRWVINTDLPWNITGSNHAWMVLRNANIGTYGIELLIDLRSSTTLDDGARLYMYVAIVQGSGDGYTGGTTTTGPTPPGTNGDDVVNIRINEGWGGTTSNIARTWQWNMWQSEDGKQTYITYFYNNICSALWLIGVPQDPNPSWSEPQFFASLRGAISDTDNACFINDWYDTNQMKTWRANRISTSNSYNRTHFYLTSDTFGFGPLSQELTTANDVSGEYPLSVIGMASRDSNFIGRQGTMFDIYWGLESIGGPSGGATYPSGGAKTWAQFGAFVFPWDGSLPVTI